MKKRGQLTLFIIIGIVIVASIGIIIGIRNFQTGELDTVTPTIEEVKSEILPIKTYTDGCLARSLKQGIKLLGEQGGYIYLEGKYNYQSPTESEGVVWDDKGIKTAYWNYNADKNEQSYRNVLKIPSKNFMEKELENYVLTETIKCLDDYSELKKIGYEIEEGENYDINVRISDSSVDALLIHKIKVSKERVSDDISNFFASHNVGLKKMHEMASYLSTFQSQNKYLEEFFLNVYSLYEGKNSRLPPMRDVGTSLVASNFWVKELVKRYVDDLMFTHIPLLQIRNTYNQFIPLGDNSEYSDVKNAIINHWSIPINNSDISEQEITDYEIKHNYLPNWNTYFDVNEENGLIKPKSTCVPFLFGSTCINRYDTIIDYSFPVVVSIEQRKAFDGEGFTFNFGLEGNIRNNLAPKGDVEVINKTIMFIPSMMCEPEGLTKEIKIKVTNRHTKRPLKDVSVFYGNEIRSCPIGITGENGFLTAKVPEGFGGILSAEREGYSTENIFLDTYLMGENDLAEIDLWQIKKIPIEVKINKLYNCKRKGTEYTCFREINPLSPNNLMETYDILGSKRGNRGAWMFIRTDSEMESDDKVLLSMERHLYDELPTGEIPSVAVKKYLFDEYISLIPGKYDVDAKLITPVIINITKEEREIEQDVDVLDPTTYDPIIKEATEDTRKFDVPSIVIDSEMFMGGYEGQISIEAGQLYSSDKIILNIFEFAFDEIPKDRLVMEDLNILGSIKTISDKYQMLGINLESD